MSHTVAEKKKLLARVARIRGQVDAIERALEGEVKCDRMLHLIAGMRGATTGLMAEVVEDHVRHHLVDSSGAVKAEAIESLLDVVRAYLK